MDTLKATANGTAGHYDVVVVVPVSAGCMRFTICDRWGCRSAFTRALPASVALGGGTGIRGTVDFPGGPFYCYTFSDELFQEYDWAETQPDQAACWPILNTSPTASACVAIYNSKPGSPGHLRRRCTAVDHRD